MDWFFVLGTVVPGILMAASLWVLFDYFNKSDLRDKDKK